MTDIFTKQKRSQIMSKIRSKNTVPERTMAAALKKANIRFLRGDKVFGKPDFLIRGKKIAVFVDGRFWHGYGYGKTKRKLTSFWRNKISDNIKRDKCVNNKLKREGWKVIRFWDFQVVKNPKICVEEINKMVEK